MVESKETKEAKKKPAPSYTAYEVGMMLPNDPNGDFDYDFLDKSQKRILGTLKGNSRDRNIGMCKEIVKGIHKRKLIKDAEQRKFEPQDFDTFESAESR